MFKSKSVIFLTTLFYGAVIYATTENYPQKNQGLKNVLATAIYENNIPGVEVTYGFKNQPLQTVAVGFSDVKNKVPLKDSSLFIVGSITKSFIAAAILELIEAQKISVDETLAEVAKQHGGGIAADVKEYPALGRVTIRQLLNHTSGVPENINTQEFVTAFIKNPERVWSDKALLEIAMKQPFYFTPGEAGAWSYTNTDYLLLGIVLKSVSKKSIPQIFSQLWIQADLKNIYYAGNGVIPQDALENLATGYMAIDGEDKMTAAFKAFPQAEIAGKQPMKAYALKTGYNVFDPTSSGIITTTQSLAQWYRALFEGSLLAPKSTSMMLDGVQTAKENNIKAGFGVSTAVIPTYGYLVTHNGIGPGYSVAVFYFFKYNLVVSIATNSSNASLDTFDISSGKLLPGLLTAIMPALLVNRRK